MTLNVQFRVHNVTDQPIASEVDLTPIGSVADQERSHFHLRSTNTPKMCCFGISARTRVGFLFTHR
jgi:hypothetical protein